MSAKKGGRHKETPAHALGAAGPARVKEVVATLKEEPLACYANADWQQDGCTPLYVLRRAEDGRIDLAVFYIDVWCCGLRDAWGDRGIGLREFAADMLQPVADGRTVTRIDTDLARRLLAGSIAFARRNGFTVPANSEKWTAFLGDLGDVDHADCSDFGLDGGMVYVGTRKDLSRRLTGTTADAFLARPDVEFVELPEGTGYDDADEEELNEEALEEIRETLVSAVRKWCFASGVKPHSKLDDAASLMLATLSTGETSLEWEDPSEEALRSLDQRVSGLIQIHSPADQAAIEEALKQLMQFSEQFETPADMLRAVGFGDLMDEE